MPKKEEQHTILNPLTPKSDQHLISPYNITPESHIKVMRIRETIINLRGSWLLNTFSLKAPYRMSWKQKGENGSWFWAVKSLNNYFLCNKYSYIKLLSQILTTFGVNSVMFRPLRVFFKQKDELYLIFTLYHQKQSYLATNFRKKGICASPLMSGLFESMPLRLISVWTNNKSTGARVLGC